MDKAAIVGAGLIGRAWAVVFARGGWDVRLTDPSAEALEAAPRLIRAALNDLAAAELVRDPAGAAALVSVAGSVAEALDGADLVREQDERVDEKRRIFAELDAAAPHAQRFWPLPPQPSSPRSLPKTFPAASAASSLIP